MQIFLARTQGFCAGVARAIETVNRALEAYGTPLYVYHEIVHNTAVVHGFQDRGVIFVNALKDVPVKSRLVFSAHGVPPSIAELAAARELRTIDATCPLVTKVHRDAVRFSTAGQDVVLIGHKGHEEVAGTAGHVRPDLLHIVSDRHDVDQLDIPANRSVGYITQTTLSVDETRELVLKLRARFPRLQGPDKDNICYATQNRQDAVRELAGMCDVIIVCGSPNSSNSNRLREKARQLNIDSHIIDHAGELDMALIQGKQNIGITSGASVPRHIVDEVIVRIRDHFGPIGISTFDNPEKNIFFPLPTI